MRITSGTIDQVIYFVAVDSVDYVTRKTGLSSFTVYRSRNGGTATVYTTPTITEMSSANMPGVYSLLLDEDMTIGAGNNSEAVVLHITATNMAPVTLQFELYRPTATEGQTLTVSSGVGLANVASIQTGVITDSAVAASAAGKIANNVWDLTATGHTTGGTMGGNLNDAKGNAYYAYIANALWGPDTLDAANSSTVTLKSYASSIDGYYNGMKVMVYVGTGSAQTRRIVNYVGSTKVATISPNWTTTPDTISGILIAPGDLLDPTANSIANAVWDEPKGAHNTTDTMGQQLRYASDTAYWESFMRVDAGTVQAGASTTVTLRAGSSSTTDFYVGDEVHIYFGTGAGQIRKITAYNGTTKVATVDAAWATAPDNTSAYIIWASSIDNAASVSAIKTKTDQLSFNSGSVYSYVTGMDNNVINPAKFQDWSGPDSKYQHYASNATIAGTSITLTDTPNSIDGFYVGSWIMLPFASSFRQVRRIVAYNGTTKVATIDRPFDTSDVTTDAVVWAQASVTAGALDASVYSGINSQVVDALAVDTYGEPGRETPPSTSTLAAKINYIYKALTNKVTQTADTFSLYSSDGLTVDQQASVSDSGTVFTRQKLEAGDISFLDDSVTLFDAWAASEPAHPFPPSLGQKMITNAFIGGLINAGLWSGFDLFYDGSVQSPAAATVNWKNPGSFDLTPTGSPEFTPFEKGFKGDGVDAVLSTGYTPMTHGVNFTADSHAFIGKSSINAQDAGVFFGGLGGGKKSYIYPRYTDDNAYGFDSGGSPISASNLDATKVVAVDRDGPSSFKMLIDGSEVATSSQSSGTFNRELTFLAGEDAGNQYSTLALGIGAAGRHMTDAEHLTFKDLVNDYITAKESADFIVYLGTSYFGDNAFGAALPTAADALLSTEPNKATMFVKGGGISSTAQLTYWTDNVKDWYSATHRKNILVICPGDSDKADGSSGETSVSAMIANIQSIVTDAKSDGWTVVVTTTPAWSYLQPAYTEDTRADHEELVAGMLALTGVDAFCDLTTDALLYDESAYLNTDLFQSYPTDPIPHPNQAGYERWAIKLAEAIESVRT